MDFLTATIFTLGIGWCDTALDYCPRPVGKIAIEQELVRFNEKNVVSFEVEHFSELGNGEPNRGDRGTELYFIEYKYRF